MMTVRDCRGAVAQSLLLFFGCAVATLADDSRTPPPALERIGSYDLKGVGGPAVDIRWADEKSVLILRPTTGVYRHKLEPDLPVDGKVLPGRDETKGWRPWEHIASHDGFVVAASGSARLIWNRRDFADLSSREPRVQAMAGGVGDIDVHGDRLAVLGMPSRQIFSDRGNRLSFVWVGGMEDGEFRSFESWYREPLERPTTSDYQRIYGHNNGGVGSLRFSRKGELLVYLGFRPQILLFSEEVRRRSTWTLEELLPGYDGKTIAEYTRMHAKREGATQYKAWLDASSLLIDDVLFVAGDPALVVRRVEEGLVSWLLGVIEGDRAAWYRIPLGEVDKHSQVKADALPDGDIVFLAGKRRPSLLAQGEDLARVVVARQP
jgi:hypothetical protein